MITLIRRLLKSSSKKLGDSIKELSSTPAPCAPTNEVISCNKTSADGMVIKSRRSARQGIVLNAMRVGEFKPQNICLIL